MKQICEAQLAEQYQQLESIGLNELSSGNVSCRFGDNMLISPSGATGSNIAPEHVVEVTLDGEWSGERKPSSGGGCTRQSTKRPRPRR